MLVKVRGLLGDFKWFHWAVLVGFGLVVGLLIVVVAVARGHTSGDKEVVQVEKAVGRHVILPANEMPALATITDPSKLKNNQLLGQAEKGDKVLIFAKWKQAVVYRPSRDRIVVIGPVDVTPPRGDTSGFKPLQ